MNPERLQLLARKYLDNTATPAEEEELNAWFHALNEQEALWPATDAAETEALKYRLQQSIHQAVKLSSAGNPIPFYRKKGWRLAASLLLLLGAGTFFWLNRTVNTGPGVINTTAIEKVGPGGNKAVLTLADGSTVILDSASNNTIAQQGNTRVIKMDDGQLVYKNQGAADAAILYNTVSTPKGGQYQVILPDGSRVWLNATSSLHFPTSFTGNERKVAITGEAYFEVAHNTAKPFLVSVNDMEIKVLGTQFNIMAYTEEQSIKTTLLEGAVQVTGYRIPATALKPGQQAQLQKSGDITIINDANVEEAVAWKNGRFYFEEASIQAIMRQIARWYDVEVVFEGNVPAEKFNGEIPRNSSIEDVFKILELSHIHFKLEGKKVIVTP